MIYSFSDNALIGCDLIIVWQWLYLHHKYDNAKLFISLFINFREAIRNKCKYHFLQNLSKLIVAFEAKIFTTKPEKSSAHTT